MARLEFLFSEFDDELRAISELAQSFIRIDSTQTLPRLRTELQGIREYASNRPVPWCISERQPLRTRCSEGQFEPQNRGGHDVFAEITSVWHIEPVRPRGQQHRRAMKFALVGNASTRVRIFEEKDGVAGRPLAIWRMEIADDSAPGVCFHTQILGEGPDPPFPHSLPIPRLPSYMFTPMLVLDFVLGELFQDAWKGHVSRDTDALRMWRRIQSPRLVKLWNWQRTELEKSAATPWMLVKSLHPRADLFTGR